MYLFKILLDILMFGFLSEECSIKLKYIEWFGCGGLCWFGVNVKSKWIYVINKK